MEIKIYNDSHKEEWDHFIRHSKNGTFLFCRDFMEYHADRFSDYSFLFYSGYKLLALMPGNISEKQYYTHQGLTYGGLVVGQKATAQDILEIFEHITVTLQNQGIRKIIYKPVPHIYHRSPSEEDLYALFRHKAELTARNISSTIDYSNRIQYSGQRKRGLTKAQKIGLKVVLSDDFDIFWSILSSNLQEKYNTQPVHSLQEITYLKEKFHKHIHLFLAIDQSKKTLGGCLIFETDKVAHIQYVAASEEGKELGAIDLIVDYVINNYAHKAYFDYGISTENNGLYLNQNLIHQKEGFGARGTIYDTYTIDLNI